MIVKANKNFSNCVFGADCFIQNWPEIQCFGIEVKKFGDLYYIVKDGLPVHNTAFFTEEEMAEGLIILEA